MLLSTSKSIQKFLSIFAILVVLSLSACYKEDTFLDLPLSGPDQVFYALSGNTLVKYNAQNIKQPINTAITIQGLSTTTERLLSIDFRPHTGELYGLSDASKIYVINVDNGAARAISQTAFSPILNSRLASIDFNPTTDRIRLVTATGQNLRINPETGQVEGTDTNTPNNVVAISYANSYAGATTTTLYDLDVTAKKLYKQDPPNSGTLQEVGSLVEDLGTNVSFDISPDGQNALAVSKTTEGTRIFSIDLTTGGAALKGKFPSSINIQSIAIPAPSVAYLIDAVNLITFNPQTTNTPTKKTLTGLQPGETIVAMTMRPFNGQVYAVSSSSRVYKVNLATGLFTSFTTLNPVLSGTSFSADFNPALDFLTIIGNDGQVLTVNATTGIVETNNTFASLNVINGIAYNKNFSSTNTTILYGIDTTADKLYSIAPTTGLITEIGPIGIDASDLRGFDIVSTPSLNIAYALFTANGKQQIYTINLTTGTATVVGELTGNLRHLTLGLKFTN